MWTEQHARAYAGEDQRREDDSGRLRARKQPGGEEPPAGQRPPERGRPEGGGGRRAAAADQMSGGPGGRTGLQRHVEQHDRPDGDNKTATRCGAAAARDRRGGDAAKQRHRRQSDDGDAREGDAGAAQEADRGGPEDGARREATTQSAQPRPARTGQASEGRVEADVERARAQPHERRGAEDGSEAHGDRQQGCADAETDERRSGGGRRSLPAVPRPQRHAEDDADEVKAHDEPRVPRRHPQVRLELGDQRSVEPLGGAEGEERDEAGGDEAPCAAGRRRSGNVPSRAAPPRRGRPGGAFLRPLPGAGRHARRRRARAAMKAGVVPQQPPTMPAPRAGKPDTSSAKCSAVSS